MNLKLRRKKGIVTRGRPRLSEVERKSRSISFDNDVLEYLDKRREESGISKSELVNEACKAYYLIG